MKRQAVLRLTPRPPVIVYVDASRLSYLVECNPVRRAKVVAPFSSSEAAGDSIADQGGKPVAEVF